MDLEINDALAMEICRDTSINSGDGWRSSPALARIGAQNPNDMTEETGTLGYVAPKVTKERNPYVKDCREEQELMQKLPDSSKSNAVEQHKICFAQFKTLLLLQDSFGKKLMDRIRPTQPRFLHSTLRPPLPRCLNPTPVPAMLMQIHSDTIAKEEFENLCLILGIELDAVTTEKAIIRKEKHIEEEEADDDEEVIYK
ncbi:hypothetical protein IGI04_016371 [Brassica rapa subsp. trilocularis]|uniref:Uncharacterized protein n=1 Tax=Brassica rapa subsp. trilocularis TaxID=1813537 RepID=A0ABQ7MST3_BRACM|nr:hypothetical protein IGI04_016371 [Brassica rapa subsp. trilocularis]